ncbi:hypothetical protein AMS68_004999 [Peltaster fructicola]|uniref:Exoribonuclease phosphorolytic domain-containing protein n=1 Tax=Peltaster fructicola TaxID=286661 RepID=A0A6H0XXI0_9PEZI|nr:hypothetical protein AMS68_004999 [Peltaster fructicola]
MQSNDRRRLNGPAGGTTAPSFLSATTAPLRRSRQPHEHRRIYLQTGTVPSAAGSAYYELHPDEKTSTLGQNTSSLKLSVTVHGPRPLPRNAAFSSNLLLNTHIKFAPFATQVRRGYVRDWSERDLGAHLENALRGVIIGERWPKSAVDVVVTILEGEDSTSSAEKSLQGGGIMTALAGAITASSAALVEAGIDCVDLVSGGVAGLAKPTKGSSDEPLVDPVSSDQELAALCVVAYLQSRDEITELWMRGNAGTQLDQLIEQATAAAKLERGVLVDALKECIAADAETKDTDMKD